MSLAARSAKNRSGSIDARLDIIAQQYDAYNNNRWSASRQQFDSSVWPQPDTGDLKSSQRYPAVSYTMNGTAPQPLRAPSPQSIAQGVTLVEPITRKGQGPGLIVLVNHISAGLWIDNDVPSPMQKWAEEGYTVVELTPSSIKNTNIISTAVEALKANSKCQPSNTIGIVGM